MTEQYNANRDRSSQSNRRERRSGDGKFFRSERSSDRQKNRGRSGRSLDERDTWQLGRKEEDRIRCPYCSDLVKPEVYKDHIYVFHPERLEKAEHSPPEERLLRRKGAAKPPRNPNVPIGMARCPECEALVPKSRLDEHIETRHGDQEETTMVECPECDAEVRSDRLDKHLEKVHS